MIPAHKQRGSSLVMLLGIIATLAILATSLVAVIANAQHNTSRERSQAKSFHVAEAALDAAMANVAHDWPLGPSATPVPFPTATFQAQFIPQTGQMAEYPGPGGASSPSVAVTYLDNQATVYHVDANRDGKMYIIAQAGVVNRQSRVKALVQRTYFEPPLPPDNVLWCGGSVLNSGVGNGVMPKITVAVKDPLADKVSADVLGSIADYPGLVDTDAVNAQFTGGPADHNSPRGLEDAFPQSARDGMVDFAKSVDRYFDASIAAKQGYATPLAAALASPKSGYGGPGLNGLTVIVQSTGQVDLLGSTVLNTQAEPGIMMLYGGIGLHLGGTAEFWGFMYMEGGTITVEKGNPIIHGALFATKDVDLRGQAQLAFDYTALSGFGSRWGQTVAMVPNTWRELRPQ